MSGTIITAVEHPFGAHDMFKQQEEESMGSVTVTVRLFAEGDQVFDDVDGVVLDRGFLTIQKGETLFAFNTTDVAAYRVEVV